MVRLITTVQNNVDKNALSRRRRFARSSPRVPAMDLPAALPPVDSPGSGPARRQSMRRRRTAAHCWPLSNRGNKRFAGHSAIDEIASICADLRGYDGIPGRNADFCQVAKGSV